MRGAWIEMAIWETQSREITSLPVRGAWIEISHSFNALNTLFSSLPVRGAWIEILYTELEKVGWKVAPCEGSVD